MDTAIDLTVLWVIGVVVWFTILHRVNAISKDEVWAAVVTSLVMSAVSIMLMIALVKVITAAVMWEIEG